MTRLNMLGNRLVGGVLTRRGADLIIIDDPLKADRWRVARLSRPPKTAHPFHVSAEWRALVHQLIAVRCRRCEDPRCEAPNVGADHSTAITSTSCGPAGAARSAQRHAPMRAVSRQEDGAAGSRTDGGAMNGDGGLFARANRYPEPHGGSRAEFLALPQLDLP